MLVLSRKRGEKINIGNGIVLTVLEIDGGKVRLGIDAPREVQIDRAENRDHKRNQQSETKQQEG